MTAAISSSTPSPTANPAIAALASTSSAANTSNTSSNVSGTADTSAPGGASVAEGDTGSAGGLFAALLQKQMNKPAGVDKSRADSALPAAADTAVEPEELQTLGSELAALLPFLEAAGLTTKPVPANENRSERTDESLPGAGQAASLAPETAPPQATLLPTGGETLAPTAIVAAAAASSAPVSPAATAATPTPTDLPQPAQVAALLPAATGGTTNSGQTASPTKMTTNTAIIADGAATAVLLDKPTHGDGKQPDFAAQLAMAQGATNPTGTQPTDREALGAIESLAPGQTQAPNNSPGAATAMHSLTNTPPAQHSTSPALPVATPVGANGWSQEVGDKVVWMANRMESRADLVLTPPDMGRIEVSLTVNGDQASATFTSANPVVRESLEAAMPRLREALADAGIQLGQTQVGAENAGQSTQQEKNGDNFAARRGAENEATPLPASIGGSLAADGLKRTRGLVDVFA